MLQRVPELEQRAYLAKFLIKVPIPHEFFQDPEVDNLNAECEELMETFKVGYLESSRKVV